MYIVQWTASYTENVIQKDNNLRAIIYEIVGLWGGGQSIQNM